VKVIFIPKAGKTNHCNPKDFRPISLSSFILKGMERLLDLHIRSLFSIEVISKSQHAYMKGRSVDTALHEVVNEIETSLESRQHTLGAFLDIEGAFNNVHIESIESGLLEIGVCKKITDWLTYMLKSRVIFSSIGSNTTKKFISRGTPQGGVISPLLWLLVINNIWLSLDKEHIKVIAYADDVVILVSGFCLLTISRLMQGALDKLSNWAKSCGLGVNSSKTELVFFSKSRSRFIEIPKLNGAMLSLSNSAKFLGIILDSKLNWNENTEHRINARNLFIQVNRRISYP
jgi:hypothetical protein